MTQKRLILIILTIAILFSSCSFFESEEYSGDERGMVYFIACGQSDAVLMRSKGIYAMIDTGSKANERDVMDFLKKQKIKAIDYLFLSHPDEDHIGNASAIIKKYDVKKVVMGGVHTSNTYLKLLQTIEKEVGEYTEPSVGDVFNVGEFKIEILGPVSQYKETNNASVVMKAILDKTSILFTGDMESKAEKDLLLSGADLRADVLKVGHHGSKTGTGANFLKAVSPQYAVIMCGSDNNYDHPHPDTLKRLKNVTVYRTDLDGTVTLLTDGKNIEIRRGDS